MTRTRTRIAWAAGLLLLLIAAAALLVPRLLGEDRVRGEAERRLSEALGRPVTIRGPVRLEAGVTTLMDANDVTIAGGVAGAPPLLVLGRVQASVATASLLSGALQVGEVRLEAPKIHLHVDGQGRANWSGLGGGGVADSAAPAWSLAGLAIERGELRYTDARSGADWSLHDWQLQAGRIALPEPLDLQTRFEARSGGTSLARVQLRARITADAAAERLVLENADLDAALVRAEGSLPVRAGIERLGYEGAAGTAEVRGLRAEAAGLALRADGAVSQLATTPVVQATLATDPFAPRDVLRALGTEAPSMAGPGALDRARVSARLDVREGTARLSALDGQLDDTRLTGTAAVTIGAPRRWTLDLAADRIVADRYLEPAALRDDSPVVLPLEFLRGVDVSGRLRVGELVAAGVKLRDVTFDLDEESRR